MIIGSLKIKTSFLALIFVLISNCTYAAIDRYNWKFNTLGHQIIQMEEIRLSDSKLVDVYDNIYKFLDKIITEAISKIQYKGIVNNEKEAIYMLGKLHGLLRDNGVMFNASMQYFHQSLSPHSYDSPIVQAKRSNLKPGARKEFDKNKLGAYYMTDCDVSAILFLSVAEVMKMPIEGVWLPGHFIIRWRFSFDRWFNYETQSGEKSVDDDGYRKRYKIDPEDERFNQYLKGLSNKDLLALYYMFFGLRLDRNSIVNTKSMDLNRSIELRPDWELPKAMLIKLCKESKNPDS